MAAHRSKKTPVELFPDISKEDKAEPDKKNSGEVYMLMNALQQIDRISYARMLVGMDITKTQSIEIKVEDPKGRVFIQEIAYEWTPTYCPSCLIIDVISEGQRSISISEIGGNAMTNEVIHQKPNVEKGTTPIAKTDQVHLSQQRYLEIWQDCRDKSVANRVQKQVSSKTHITSANDFNILHNHDTRYVTGTGEKLEIQQSWLGKKPPYLTLNKVSYVEC
ncbi:hypothetical protein HAX54_019281 [Datura stramonium]|uniref:Uncharacterized protein n=1 Tax=Datura stramonium TaxID=4076 RepID=A0ABS8S584_DATST|nr:hypothetical protein [Datura stramonium]